eukprot:5596670-Pyramimonas_sp.AAC.1
MRHARRRAYASTHVSQYRGGGLLRLDAVSRSRKLARRSSFGSGLLAAGGTADGLQVHLGTLHEMVLGFESAEEIRRLAEEGDFAVPPAELAVDGASVFAALAMDP